MLINRITMLNSFGHVVQLRITKLCSTMLNDLESVCLRLNPLSLRINMHILLSVLQIFLMVLGGRICTNIKPFCVS